MLYFCIILRNVKLLNTIREELYLNFCTLSILPKMNDNCKNQNDKTDGKVEGTGEESHEESKKI